MYTLLLRINGPLQSWGRGSLYDDRGTEYYPTKSGIIGMLAASLGMERSDSLEELNALQYGVRIDNQGTILQDFQITQMPPYNTNLSKRRYLSDATFLVGLCCEDRARLEKLNAALENPYYSIYLGRKSCPPTLPIVIGIREGSLYESLCNEEWLVPEWYRNNLFKWNDKLNLRIIVESDSGAVVKDKPMSFDTCNRIYGHRYIKEMHDKVVYKLSNDTATEHDPMIELG